MSENAQATSVAGAPAARNGGTGAAKRSGKGGRGLTVGIGVDVYKRQMQQLQAAGMFACYWGTTSKSEVDFVVQKGNDVIPIEVKSVSYTHLDVYKRQV